MGSDGKTRCDWANGSDLYMKYHDEEWGTPCHDEKKLFEMLILEGQQAGLSWITILNKRESYREAFDSFDPYEIALYNESNIASLMLNSGIIRNRLKIESVVTNSKAYLKLICEFGSLDSYLWGWVNGTPVKNCWQKLDEVPAQTELSNKISKDLKKRGFKFVGPIIIYAFMQAIGMVDDHIAPCFKH